MSFTMLPAASESLWEQKLQGIKKPKTKETKKTLILNKNFGLDIKLHKLYRSRTFSLSNWALLLSVSDLSVFFSFRVLVVEVFTAGFIGTALVSSDFWPLLFLFARPLLWACCGLEVHNEETYWSSAFVSFESLLISDASEGGDSWFLSLRTCCSRSLSWLCSCFWQTELEAETDHFDDKERSWGPNIAEQGSKERKITVIKTLIIVNGINL